MLVRRKGDISLVSDVFFEVTEALSKFLKEAGAPILSDPSKIYASYLSSSIDMQVEFLGKCKFYSGLIRSALASDISIIEDKRFVWMALSELNCLPSSDLMDMIKDGDAVELYDTEGVMIFSNFDFCIHTTYTIEELFWHPWVKLFGRSDENLNSVMREFLKAITAVRPFAPDVPKHVIWELLEGHDRKGAVKMKMFAPLKSKHGPLKYIISASEVFT